MMKTIARWLINYFNLNHYETVEKVPDPSLIGSTWISKYRDPWEDGMITIIDEKCGWVRYQYPTRTIKWSMTTKDLRYLYNRAS